MRFLTSGLLSISRITSLAELTYYLPRSNKPIKQFFESEKEFDKFVAGRELYHMNDGGATLSIITTMKTARAAMAVPKTRLTLDIPYASLPDDVSKLNGYVDNEASSLEVQTTLAIARDDTFANEYGTLELVNEGRGVTFYRASDTNHANPLFQIDGLVKNSTVLLMNKTKMRLHEADAQLIASLAGRLQDALKNPDGYTTQPEDVLSEIAGLDKVVPIASTNGCKPGAKDKCAELGIHLVMPDGSGFAATLHKLPQQKQGGASLGRI